jgi:hypothetical protein
MRPDVRSPVGFQEVFMKRFVLAGLLACIGAVGALAADPKIEAAIKTFQAIAADPGRVKTFCEMIQVMDATGDKEDPAAEAKITGLMKQLGPDFEAAWNTADEVDEDTPDGKDYNAAMDSLADKCS